MRRCSRDVSAARKSRFAALLLLLVSYPPLAPFPSDVPKTPSHDVLRKGAQPPSGFRSG